MKLRPGKPASALTGTGGQGPSAFSRAPAYTYLGLMLVMLLIFALFTLSTPPTPPPAIAEIAPQALEQITEAPREQAVSGSGEGDGAAGPGATPAPDDPAILTDDEGPNVATPFRCVGDPPSQIEDPQSPPCVPHWQGDNGGVTSKGVTGDTITVIAPDSVEDSSATSTLNALQAFFNTRFQFYGRKLDIIGGYGDRPGAQDPDTLQRGHARAVDENYSPFASLATRQNRGRAYIDELAHRGIIGVMAYSQFSQEALRGYQPYVWTYGMSIDRLMSLTGEWVCERLAGRSANYTSDPTLRGRTRTFGLIYSTDADYTHKSEPLEQELEACGSPFEVIAFQVQGKEQAGAQTYEGDPYMQDKIIQMKDRGVTSVLAFHEPSGVGAAQRIASNQEYFPEWVVTSDWELEQIFQHHPPVPGTEPNQRRSMIGLSIIPRLIRAENDPAVWAVQEGNAQAFGPSQDTSVSRQLVLQDTYRMLLLLSSGIQMAGPNLTPHTFAKGLHRTVFPNRDHPIMAGHVGFQGGSYSMTIDAAEMWWSETTRPPFRADSRTGTWCYVDGGQRRYPGYWPGEPKFFEPPCDSDAPADAGQDPSGPLS